MLPVNHRQTVHPNGTLKVENVQQRADQGTYTCQARNRQGLSDKGSVVINVMGKLHETEHSVCFTLSFIRFVNYCTERETYPHFIFICSEINLPNLNLGASLWLSCELQKHILARTIYKPVCQTSS